MSGPIPSLEAEAKIERLLALLKAMIKAYPDQPISVWFHAITLAINETEK